MASHPEDAPVPAVRSWPDVLAGAVTFGPGVDDRTVAMVREVVRSVVLATLAEAARVARAHRAAEAPDAGLPEEIARAIDALSAPSHAPATEPSDGDAREPAS